MAPYAAVQSARRFFVRLGRGLSRRNGEPLPARPEFARINKDAGIEPVRPELSGLEIRAPVSAPARSRHLLIQLQYRWQPSDEYHRRVAETQRMNYRQQQRPFQPVLPPVLTYGQETVMTPERRQPFLGEEIKVGGALGDRDEARDLRDLEALERRSNPWVIGPLVPDVDQSYFLADRPLLPRSYRAFLRHSPYPRAAATLTGAALIVAVIVWTGQPGRVEAIATSHSSSRSALQAVLDGAVTYGVDPRALRPLQLEVHSLASVPATQSAMSSRVRLYSFRREERQYVALRAAVQHLEHRAFDYWTWREGVTYAPLVEATQQARRLGIQVAVPPLPACGTARCFQRAVVTQRARTFRLRRSILTAHRDATEVAAAPGPRATAGTEVAPR